MGRRGNGARGARSALVGRGPTFAASARALPPRNPTRHPRGDLTMASPLERIRIGILTAALVALAAGGWAQAIKIGIRVGLSGANSVVAPSVVQSAELAAEEINAKGGIMGKKVVLEVADDGSGAAGAQKAFDSLIFQKQVNVLISMETSAALNAGLPIVTRGKTPFIYTSFYEGRSCNKYLYVDAWVRSEERRVGKECRSR